MPTPKEIYEAGVQSFEEARRALPDALGRMSEASKELAKGNITQEARAEWRGKFDAAYDELKAGKARAEALKSGTEALGAALEPVHRHPVTEPVVLGADEAIGGDRPARGGDDVQRFAGDPRERIVLSGRARALLNRTLAGGRRNGGGFAALSREDREFLSGPRKEALMSPYVDSDGGMVTAEEFRNEVIRHQRDMVYIRSRARVIPTTAASVTFPTMKIDLRLAKTRAGIGNGQTPTILSKVFGKTRFTPSGESRIVKVPEELLEDATFDVIGFISQEIAQNDLESEEEKFLTGSGAGEPLGILTALERLKDNGFTGLTYPIAGATTAMTPEEVKLFPYQLKKKYRQGAVWMSCRAFIQAVSIMRDGAGGAGTGQFLFKAGLESGDSDQIVGYDFLESEFFPDVFASGADQDKMALFGNLQYYWIIDRKSLDLRVLPELYTETDEVGYKYTKRFDAAPVRPDAFVAMERN